MTRVYSYHCMCLSTYQHYLNHCNKISIVHVFFFIKMIEVVKRFFLRDLINHIVQTYDGVRQSESFFFLLTKYSLFYKWLLKSISFWPLFSVYHFYMIHTSQSLICHKEIYFTEGLFDSDLHVNFVPLLYFRHVKCYCVFCYYLLMLVYFLWEAIFTI